MDENRSLESRVAKVEGQLAQLVSTVGDFITASDNWRREVSKEISRLSENLFDKTRPNLTLYISCAGLGVTIIVAFMALLGYFFSREMERGHQDSLRQSEQSRTDFKALDDKLQREFQLMINNAEQKYQEADKNSKERHENVKRDVDTLRLWQNSADDADRSELRARRLRDSGWQEHPQSSIVKPNSRTAAP